MGLVFIQHDPAYGRSGGMILSTRAWLYVPSVVRMLVPSGMPGVYLLGRVTATDNSFVPRYIGRSDFNLRQRLANHEKLPLTTHFCFHPCESIEESFTRECFYWHALCDEPWLLNSIHPDSPSQTGLQCPYCSASHQFSKYVQASGVKKRKKHEVLRHLVHHTTQYG